MEKEEEIVHRERIRSLMSSLSYESRNPHPMQSSCLIPIIVPPPPYCYPSVNSYHNSPPSRQTRHHRSLNQVPPHHTTSKKIPHDSQYSTLYSPEPTVKSPQIPNKIPAKQQFNRSKFKKRINDLHRYDNRQDTRKRLRKAFLAVYFLCCLKKVRVKILSERQKFFASFWPKEFTKFEESFK